MYRILKVVFVPCIANIVLQAILENVDFCFRRKFRLNRKVLSLYDLFELLFCKVCILNSETD